MDWAASDPKDRHPKAKGVAKSVPMPLATPCQQNGNPPSILFYHPAILINIANSVVIGI
jgi:hypothetical protein